MTRKPEPGPESLLQWLRDRGEEALSQVVEELAKNKAFTGAAARAVKRAARAKGQIDQNMQAVLSLLNLPSRGDYERLQRKVEALHGSLLNINIKLDRLLAAQMKAKSARREKGEDER